MNATHGMSHTRVFKIWLGVLDRCRNDRQGNYGKRGITVCAKWENSFEAFYRDMGEPPSRQHSIDRINVDGNYEPSNCRWASRKEQANNTTRNTILTVNNESHTIAQWCERIGMKPTTLCWRLSKGMTPESAMSAPVRPWRINQPWVHEGVSRSTWYRRRSS